MSSPVSELESRCSATPSSSHGIMISTTAKATSGRQADSTAPSRPLARATGSSSTLASAVRARTSVLGEISSTATLISRYGMPQITPIARKRTQPRLLMTPLTSHSLSGVSVHHAPDAWRTERALRREAAP